MRFLIRNVNIANAHQIELEMDVVIEEGRITEVHPDKAPPSDTMAFDGTGLWLFPAFADLYCHFREPGFTHRVDLAEGARSAAAGGYADIGCMPNTNPVLDRPVLVEDVLHQASDAVIRIEPIGALTHCMKGTRVTNFEKLHKAGAIAFSDDARPIADEDVMTEAMMQSAAVRCPVLVEEDTSGSETAPEKTLRRDLALAERTGGHLHVCQLRSKDAVRAVADAKRKHVGKITCDVSPSVFFGSWVASEKANADSFAEENRRAVLRAIMDGTIDAVVTNHRPDRPTIYSRSEEHEPFRLMDFTDMFTAVITALYQPGLVSLPRIVELLSTRPRQIMNLTGGRIAKGEPADVVLCDVDNPLAVDASTSAGTLQYGRVLMTCHRGRIVYDVSKSPLR